MRRSRYAGLVALAVILTATGCGGEGGDDERETDSGASDGARGQSTSAVWVASGDANEVYRVDVADGSVGEPIPAGTFPFVIQESFGSLWVAATGQVIRIDSESGESETIDASTLQTLAVGEDEVWIADDEAVMPINPDDNTVGTPIPLPEDTLLKDLVYSDGVLYGCNFYDGGAVRIDTGSGEVVDLSPEDLGDADESCTSVLVDGDSVYLGTSSHLLVRDAADLTELDDVAAPARAWSLALADDGLLAVADDLGSVRSFDPKSGEFSAPVTLSDSSNYSSLASDQSAVWAAVDDGTLLKLDPSTLEIEETFSIPGVEGNASLALVE